MENGSTDPGKLKREQLRRLLRDRATLQPARPGPAGIVVPIREAGRRIPLYCVLGGGAGLASYQRLSKRLDVDQPIYGLQLAGLTVSDPALRSIQGLAKLHFAAVQEFQPAGPVALCGHSMSAVVAIELAQQLANVGRTVTKLILIDQPGPDVKLSAWNWIYWQWVAITNLPGRQKIGYVLEGLRYRFESNQKVPAFLRKRVGFRRRGSRGAMRTSPSSVSYRMQMMELNIAALKAYQPKPYLHPMVLVRAKSGAPRLHADRFGGWGQIAKAQLEVIDIAGHHMNIFQSPHVETFAQRLNECLESGH